MLRVRGWYGAERSDVTKCTLIRGVAGAHDDDPKVSEIFFRGGGADAIDCEERKEERKGGGSGERHESCVCVCACV